ncbi:MAG: alpha/beta hydrolase family protein [Acidimicrobiales bacterium]
MTAPCLPWAGGSSRDFRSGLLVRRTPGRRTALTVTVIAMALLGSACARASTHLASRPTRVALPTTSTASTTTTSIPSSDPKTALGPNSFVVSGPYAVGDEQVQIPGGPVMEIWYPATAAAVAGKAKASYDVRDWMPDDASKVLPANLDTTFEMNSYDNVAAAHGYFPLILYSHGYAGFPEQSSFLTTHLASWGFVVAAPDNPYLDLKAVLLGTADDQNSDVADVIKALDFMTNQNSTPGSRLQGRIDLTRVATLGHSDGGRAAVLAAFDPRVKAFIGLAGAAGPPGDGPQNEQFPVKPGMVITGSLDQVVPPVEIQMAYVAMAPPKRFLEINGAGHMAYTDECAIARPAGGVLNALKASGFDVSTLVIALSTDGCGPDNLAIGKGWDVIRQAVVAQLRLTLGIDHSDAGLAGIAAAFPGVSMTASYAG